MKTRFFTIAAALATLLMGVSAPAQAQEIRDHDLVKGTGPAVYYIAKGTRRWITNPNVMQQLHFSFGNVRNVPDSTLSVYPQTGNVQNPILVKGSGPAVYLVDDGGRHWVTSPAVMQSHGFSWESILDLTDEQLSRIPEGEQVR